MLTNLLNADKILNKSLACPTMDAYKKAPLGDDYLNLNMYAISHNCKIFYRNSEIQVLGYDPRNSKSPIMEIVDKVTGIKYFINRSSVQVEQGGKKSTYRF